MTTLVGKKIGPVGYGLMNLTWRPEPLSDEQTFAAMKAALNNGANFWNGGEFYGTPEHNSLHLLNRYFTKYPEDADKVVLSIKGAAEVGGLGPDGSRKNIQRSLDTCLRILDGKKTIDIFEQARQDPKVPLEESIAALAEYVKAGKIGGIGISEVTADQIRANAALHPIAAVEVELSITSPDILSNGVAATCTELGIPIVAYSPLGRGLLSGRITKPSDLPKGDFRTFLPRFQEGTLEKNAELGAAIKRIGDSKGCSAAQIAIAWAAHWSKSSANLPTIVPIPGGTTAERVTENAHLHVLSDAEFKQIEKAREEYEIVGGRYPSH